MSAPTERDAAVIGAAEPGNPGPGTPSRKRVGSRLREGRAAWTLALPFVLLFLVFTVWPVLQSLFMSFTDTKAKDLRTPFSVNVVGLENYTRALGDETFLRAARNTARAARSASARLPTTPSSTRSWPSRWSGSSC